MPRGEKLSDEAVILRLNKKGLRVYLNNWSSVTTDCLELAKGFKKPIELVTHDWSKVMDKFTSNA